MIKLQARASALLQEHSDVVLFANYRISVSKSDLEDAVDQDAITRAAVTEPTIDLVKAALGSKLRWMIREGHPQAHSRWPSGKGRVYLAFSPTRENHWSVAIDSFSESKGDFAHAVFNGKYHHQFLQASSFSA
ncbi:MAG: hypothetical protein ACXIU7_08690 [Roseinatronobacter sp.]